MRVALYLRRSTSDLQPESLTTQEALLRRYAAEHEHEVVRVYADSSSGRFVEGRDAFQRLIRDVREQADFRAILVRDVSRWSRAENLDEAGFYEFVCRSHGVDVVYVDEAFAPDTSPYNVLLKSVKRAMAAEFSRERSRQVASAQVRAVQRGFWPHGAVPYGMKRVLVDQHGQHLRDLLPGDRKSVASHRVKIAPGDPSKVGVVQGVFTSFVLKGKPVGAIVAALNDASIPSPGGGKWRYTTVAHVLRNEIYTGALVHFVRGSDTRTDFLNLRDDENARIIRTQDAHPAIIDRALWESAQKLLRDQGWRRSDVQLMADLREHQRRWHGAAPSGPDGVTAHDLRKGYGVTDEKVIGAARDLAFSSLRAIVARTLEVSDTGDGWLIDHLLRVRLAVSLPRAFESRLQWDFAVEGSESVDVILGLAFSPPPLIAHVETFLFNVRYFTRHDLTRRRPALDPQIRTGKFIRMSSSALVPEALRRSIVYSGARAQERLRDALADRAPAPRLSELAATLRWPVHALRETYGALRAHNPGLPPLLVKSERAPCECGTCGGTRFLWPAAVRALRGRPYLCPRCARRQRRATGSAGCE